VAAAKTWLVTGCDSGIGHAIAETVLEHGHAAIVTALDVLSPTLAKYPLLRIPLGEDSIDRLEKKIAAQAAEFQKWKAPSLSIAFD
jgi:NAD(P)-dependent dehydrogenase (short-subunit alcohol dehydrogenase family)